MPEFGFPRVVLDCSPPDTFSGDRYEVSVLGLTLWTPKTPSECARPQPPTKARKLRQGRGTQQPQELLGFCRDAVEGALTNPVSTTPNPAQQIPHGPAVGCNRNRHISRPGPGRNQRKLSEDDIRSFKPPPPPRISGPQHPKHSPAHWLQTTQHLGSWEGTNNWKAQLLK